MIELLLLPLLCGIALVASLAPLGCFVLWRKMAFFGDTVAHSMLIGVALGLLFNINISISIIAFAAFIALILSYSGHQGLLPSDSILSIVSHASLALGLLALSLFADQRVNLLNFLVGDILSVNYHDLIYVSICSMLCLAYLSYFWRALLGLVINKDLCEVEGDNSALLNLGLMLATAIVIAVAVRIVGILLITALMIIPAASARLISRSPEAMAWLAGFYGVLALVLGIIFSFYYNSATGPTIVSAASVLLGGTALARFALIKKTSAFT